MKQILFALCILTFVSCQKNTDQPVATPTVLIEELNSSTVVAYDGVNGIGQFSFRLNIESNMPVYIPSIVVFDSIPTAIYGSEIKINRNKTTPIPQMSVVKGIDIKGATFDSGNFLLLPGKKYVAVITVMITVPPASDVFRVVAKKIQCFTDRTLRHGTIIVLDDMRTNYLYI